MRWSGLTRTLVILSLAGLPLGCTTISPLPRFQLEQPGEPLAQTTSGRFVLRGTDSLGQPQGTQGRFEWLTYGATIPSGSINPSRKVLILIGPLGQSVGVLEKVSTNNNIVVYDHQGLLLGPDHRRDVLIQLLGQDAGGQTAEQDVDALLIEVVRFFDSASVAGQRRAEQGFRLGPAQFTLTVLMDT